jgi:hypothetical protein
MTKIALAVLETALRDRKLDRTLTTALPTLERADASATLPTAITTLDAGLHGGLPRGQLSEIAGPRSSGRMTLLLHFLSAATRRGEIAALVDTFDQFDVPSAADAGVALDRVLWIRGDQVAGALVDRQIDRALKALNLVLTAGGFGLVVLDFSDVALPALRRVPFTTWLRVQRTIEASDTVCLLMVPQPVARSAGGLTLSVTARTTWLGTADRSRRMAGVDITVRIVSPRRRVDGECLVHAYASESVPASPVLPARAGA